MDFIFSIRRQLLEKENQEKAGVIENLNRQVEKYTGEIKTHLATITELKKKQEEQETQKKQKWINIALVVFVFGVFGATAWAYLRQCDSFDCPNVTDFVRGFGPTGGSRRCGRIGFQSTHPPGKTPRNQRPG